MFESELSQLFTEEEITALHKFISSWFKYPNKNGILESYWFVCDIQSYINNSFKDLEERKNQILEIAVEKFPQLIGYTKENN